VLKNLTVFLDGFGGRTLYVMIDVPVRYIPIIHLYKRVSASIEYVCGFFYGAW